MGEIADLPYLPKTIYILQHVICIFSLISIIDREQSLVSREQIVLFRCRLNVRDGTALIPVY
jgi:hypothetical protein